MTPLPDERTAGAPWPGFTPDRVTTRVGNQLYLERGGTGDTTVVFEAGMGASRNTWGAVAPLVAGEAEVVVYDRAGLGRSAPTDTGRGLAGLVADLHDVIASVDDGPIVLVGHSWGGPIIRRAAAERPDRIVGLVLVDPTDERCDLFFSKANQRQTAIMRRIGPVLARTGAIRLGVERLATRLPEPAATALVEEDGTLAAVVAQQRELATCIADLGDLREHPPRIPEVPFVIISGTKTSVLERGRRPALIEAHRTSATEQPLGRHVEARRSSHYVPFTEPDLVAAEILTVADDTPARPEQKELP